MTLRNGHVVLAGRLSVFRAFQVRSPERDAKTDRERIHSLGRAINTSIDSIQREKAALQARVNEARDLAALAAGTDVDEYLYRDPKDLTRVRDYEQQMARGDRRLNELQRQLEGLGKLREVYAQCFGNLDEPGS
jgi:hypothetical protein